MVGVGIEPSRFPLTVSNNVGVEAVDTVGVEEVEGVDTVGVIVGVAAGVAMLRLIVCSTALLIACCGDDVEVVGADVFAIVLFTMLDKALPVEREAGRPELLVVVLGLLYGLEVFEVLVVVLFEVGVWFEVVVLGLL